MGLFDDLREECSNKIPNASKNRGVRVPKENILP